MGKTSYQKDVRRSEHYTVERILAKLRKQAEGLGSDNIVKVILNAFCM
jgi:hypothetical protein